MNSSKHQFSKPSLQKSTIFSYVLTDLNNDFNFGSGASEWSALLILHLVFLTSHPNALQMFCANEKQTLKYLFLIVNQYKSAERGTIRIFIVEFRNVRYL